MATTKPRRPGLSKSRITALEQCPRKLWLSVHRPDLAEMDEGSEARFAAGHEVGAIACKLHPEGVMVEADDGLGAALAQTRALIDAGHPGPIFEATFEHDGVLVRVDVLARDRQGWRVAEVKSSTAPKAYHHGDLATQIWVLRGAGITVTRAAIRHVNREFVLEREGDHVGLFTDAELLSAIEETVAGRGAVAEAARQTLAGIEPEIAPGDHCSSPFDCEFSAWCGGDLPVGPEWPVSILPYGGGKKWAAKGIEDLLSLDENALPPLQAKIVTATRTGIPFHDAAHAVTAMQGWGFPRTWLDFETIQFAVPRWLGTRPYEQIPFQYSAHIEAADGSLQHQAFLVLDGSDPRRACAESLVANVPADGAIIAYNAGFERSVLKGLASQFEDLAAPLLAMAERTVDLLPVARQSWYHRDQRGSWSIKAVLPTLSNLAYDSLAVADGMMAQAAWHEASSSDCAPARRTELGNALHEYCAQDTWAMIAVARALVGVWLRPRLA